MSADLGPVFRPGESVAAYRIERLLGSGGMGAVVQAYDTTLHRRVALKVLTGATGDTARTQLLREARSAAGLSHPNICTIYEVGEVDRCAFIAMEYVDGRSIRSQLDGGGLTLDEAIRYGMQAADALAWAHEHGVVHRDLKAANVIVTGDGRLKVVDFGLARRSDPTILDATTMMSIAAPGNVAGTPYAMAPEQVRGQPTDPRTDIWALGVLLYEMVTGAQPFASTSVPEIFSAVLRDAPAPHRALTPGLQRIVGRCLEKDPGARYQQAHEVRTALEALQSTSAPTLQPADHRRRVSPVVAVSAGLAAMLAIVLGVNAGAIRDRLAGGATRGGPTTLVVLPLVNTTSDRDQQPFIDGLTEQLARSLGRSDPKALRVVASALSMPHAGSNRPIAEIARELEADHLLRGSVTRAGDRVGVTVELIRAADNRRLWQDSYDLRVSDLFTLDSDISGAVSRALDVAPLVNNPASASKARAVDPAAFDLYLRGVSHTLRTSEPELDRAIALLEQSAAIDPAFQPTQAYLALAYGNKSATYRPNEPIWEEKAFAAAQKALLLDPDSPEAHYAQAVVLWRPSHAFPSREALAELRKALAVRQNFDEAWHQYGLILMHIGHLDEAVPAFERAVQLNPGNTLARFRFGPVRIYQLKFEEALAAINRVPPDTFPAQWIYQRAWALLSLGRLDEARVLIDRALVDNPADQGGVLHSARGMLRAMAGDRSGAEADIAEAIRVGKSFLHFHHTAYAIGAIYTRLGDMDRAQEWIENAANDGFPNFTYFETDPHLERLRAVPRFKAFLAKLRQEWEHLPGESN